MAKVEKKKVDSTESQKVIDYFIKKFFDKYTVLPSVSWPWCTKMVNNHLKSHSVDGLKRIIDLYFENEKTAVHHLPTILSDYMVNKYLPQIKFDPRMYEDVHEKNKLIY